MSVTLTEAAARHVQKALTNRGRGVGLRLGVRPSGCSGLSYLLEFADEAQPDDLRFDSGGVTVLVDSGDAGGSQVGIIDISANQVVCTRKVRSTF